MVTTHANLAILIFKLAHVIEYEYEQGCVSNGVGGVVLYYYYSK